MTRENLWDFFKELSGIENIWWSHAGQNFTGRPLLILKILSSISNNPDYLPPDEDGISSMVKDDLITLSLTLFTEETFDAFDEMIKLRDKLFLISSQQKMREAGFVFVQVLQNVTDISEVTGTVWESRATLDIQLRRFSSKSDTIGLIENVEGEGEIFMENQNETIILDCDNS